jgi:microcystin-dependent protein
MHENGGNRFLLIPPVKESAGFFRTSFSPGTNVGGFYVYLTFQEETMNKIKKIAPTFIVFAVIALVIFAQDALIVYPDGKVGILTTEDPQSELEVNGRIRDKTGFVMPVGTIIAYGGTTAPPGWLMCDGAGYDYNENTEYSDLFNIIQTNFGTTGGTKFNVPDLRGMFLRGVDGGTGNDPDAATRFVNNTGGNTGDAVGSEQLDEFKRHYHDLWGSGYSGNDGKAFRVNPDGVNEGPIYRYAGGNETRPKNVYVNYIIKY